MKTRPLSLNVVQNKRNAFKSFAALNVSYIDVSFSSTDTDVVDISLYSRPCSSLLFSFFSLVFFFYTRKVKLSRKRRCKLNFRFFFFPSFLSFHAIKKSIGTNLFVRVFVQVDENVEHRPHSNRNGRNLMMIQL